MTKPTLKHISISFPEPVYLPDGFEQVLNSLINMVCEQYEREHPDRVMWPAGTGFLPMGASIYSDEGPLFDETTYSINCSEREDIHGNNRHNPNRDALKKAVKEAARQQGNFSDKRS